MRHELGLHTKDEQDQAMGMVSKSHARGVEAAERGDRAALAFETGFIHAIMALAKLAGAWNVEGLAMRQRNDLDRRGAELS